MDETSRNQDRFQAAVVIAGWVRGTITPETLAEAIHEAWRCWIRARGEPHPHAQPFREVHASDPGEHGKQAARVADRLSSVARG